MKKALKVLGLVGIAICTGVGTVYAGHVITHFAPDPSNYAILHLHSNSDYGGRTFTYTPTNFNSNIEYWAWGMFYQDPDFRLNGVGPGGTYTVLRVQSEDRVSVMDFGLELYNVALYTDLGIKLGSGNANILGNTNGDVIITLGS